MSWLLSRVTQVRQVERHRKGREGICSLPEVRSLGNLSSFAPSLGNPPFYSLGAHLEWEDRGSWPWNPAFATYIPYDIEKVLPPLCLSFLIYKMRILIIPVSWTGENSTTEPPVQAT